MKKGFIRRRLASCAMVVMVAALSLPVWQATTVTAKAWSITREDAVSWAKRQDGQWYDVDGIYGAQCTDFATAYMNYLMTGNTHSGTYRTYNANQYPGAFSNNPNWQVIQNYAAFVPQPGDLFVTTGSIPAYGHIGVVISSTVETATVVDQNTRYVSSNGSSAWLHNIGWNGSYNPTYFIRFKNFASPAPVTPAPTAPVTNKVSQWYAGGSYMEGWYEGEWSNNKPNGYGKITFNSQSFADGYYYTLPGSAKNEKATSYVGNFQDGWRVGQGTMYFEGGYKDEGAYYGLWQAGKIVFKGTRYVDNDTQKGYWPLTITATSATDASVALGTYVDLRPKEEEKQETIEVVPEEEETEEKSEEQEPNEEFNNRENEDSVTEDEKPWQYDESVIDEREDNEPYTNSTVSFWDVSRDSWYYDAVSWAVGTGITSGTSAETFSPDMQCTRAQAVTFLWKAAGQPMPKSTKNQFTDVSRSAYYYNAVLWAAEQGITSGTSDNIFSPQMTVTRAQCVTFLWKAAGSPNTGSSIFRDVSSKSYYVNAVKWAVANNITSGTGNNMFSPDASCTRAQIVTFLYKDSN